MSDRDRFEQVYASHYNAVLRYCARRSNREDALDAAADTFAVAWRRHADIPTSHELPWLYGVARRVLANQRRSASRQQAAVLRLRVVDDDPTDEPDRQVVRSQESREVIAALARLNPADQEVIRLAGWEELGRREIAVVLDCSPNAVTKRLNRALDHLARQLRATGRAGGGFFRQRKVAK